MKKLTIILTTTLFMLGCKQSQKTDYQQGIANYEQHTTETQLKYDYPDTYLSFNPEDKIIIIGLEDVSIDRLYYAEKVIKNYYGLKTEVKTQNMKIDDIYYSDQTKTTVVCSTFVRGFTSKDRVIFLTDKQMKGYSGSVRGYTTVKGRVVIATSKEHLEETVIHEIGHTYGLLHCDNLTCIMAIYNDEQDSGKLCATCKRNINFKK